MYNRNAAISSADYEAFKDFLQQACGILLGNGKEYLVSSRLNGVMKEAGIASLGELLKQIKSPIHSRLNV
ncbi:MAG: chemotaxis protein CheR, partial [Candidatus Thiodiazotropha taylori]